MIEQRSTLSPTKCSRILSAPLHRSSKSQSRKKDRSSFLVSLFPSIISSASFCISMFFPPPGKFELIVLFFVLIVNLFLFKVNNCFRLKTFFSFFLLIFYCEIPRIVSWILFFFKSTLITLTSTMSPTLTASNGCLIYLSVICEMCTSPS